MPTPAIVDGETNPFQAVFIRAPVIESLDDPSVETLASIKHEYHEGKEVGEKVVAVKQGHVLGTAFHPELTPDTRWHAYFVEMVAAGKKK